MSSIFEFVKEGKKTSAPTTESPQTNSSFSIFDAAKEMPDEKIPSRAKSLVSAPIKGILKGASEIAETSPLIARGPVSHEMFERLTNEILPTLDKPIERYLEKGGKVATMLAGPGKVGPKLIRGGLATIGSQTAKELGLSEGWQTAIELGALATPAKL